MNLRENASRSISYHLSSDDGYILGKVLIIEDEEDGIYSGYVKSPDLGIVREKELRLIADLMLELEEEHRDA